MVAMRMQESKFGAPEGVYVARFLGVAPFKGDGQPRMGRDGKPMEPGLEWQFLVEEGPYKGKVVGRITGQVPTTGNACGRLLRGVVGRQIGADEEVDPARHVDQVYQVVVKPSTMNPERTQVDMVMPYQRGGAPAPAPSTPPGPPPRRPAAAPAAPAKFWVDQGQDNPSLMDRQHCQDWIAACGLKAAEVTVCPEGSQEWKPASEHGFTDGIPF